jgi:hypothetical protein
VEPNDQADEAGDANGIKDGKGDLGLSGIPCQQQLAKSRAAA